MIMNTLDWFSYKMKRTYLYQNKIINKYQIDILKALFNVKISMAITCSISIPLGKLGWYDIGLSYIC